MSNVEKVIGLGIVDPKRIDIHDHCCNDY